MSTLFQDKVVLVTGGSRGIGRAISLKFAEEGAQVLINFLRNRKAAEQTASDVVERGGKAHLLKVHLGDIEKLKGMFEEIGDKFGRLDIFINNAASGVARSALELNQRDWQWTMDINARAFLFGAQQAAKLMEGRGGKIIAISSLGSAIVWPKYTMVGVSKAALETLTRYLAIELASQNISVNTIAASAVQTEALKQFIPNESSDALWQATPVGRMVTPEDIANVVAFLCSDSAYMIRGQTIIIDGGLSLAGAYFLPPQT
jgi:enoyl-[acyl-carrier protein] reductase III